MSNDRDLYCPAPGEIVFLPLGGSGEIGMNLNLYGSDGRWMMVDLGIGFCDAATPGVDVMVADPDFIVRRRDDLAGIVLTHAHEDHLGAVAILWPRLRCPIYASPFAAAVLRRKLADADLISEVPLAVIESGSRFDVGPFSVEFVAAAHSIPESHIVAIRSAAGLIVHATDWKLDPGPVVGPITDEGALCALGDEGVDVLMCDSTNAFVDGRSGSETALGPSLTEVIGECSGRVVVACFSSNIARISTIVRAAIANDRETCVVGRSLWRMVEVARETGYLADLPRLLTENEVGYLPPEKAVVIITGSQGEPRAALTRVAANDHPNVSLAHGDTVIFSSRMIPGNEIAIGRLQNQLARQGIEVIVDGPRFVHVSGHPGRNELNALYGWLRPKALIPIHGEARHLLEHVTLAREAGIQETMIAENGTLVRLCPGPPSIRNKIDPGRLAVDGSRLVPLDGSVLRIRRHISYSGSAVATVIINKQGELTDDPRLTLHGVVDGSDDDSIMEDAIDGVIEAVESLPDAASRDDETVAETARRAIRRAVHKAIGKRPVTEIHVVRI